MCIERRYFKIESKLKTDGEEEKPVFTGKAILFNRETKLCEGIYEKISEKAFEEAIDRDDIRCLFNHDPNFVLGRNKSGTLSLEKREDGLYFNVIPPNNQWCEDLKESVKRGDINQCSFAFTVKKDDFKMDEEGGVHRTIMDGKLYDVSIVTYPAYEETLVDVRSKVDEFKRAEKNNIEQNKKIDTFLKERGYTSNARQDEC